MAMKIRAAEEKDLAGVGRLLDQVHALHHEGRPDIFIEHRKYLDDELRELFKDPKKPVYVAVDEDDEVTGYVFCQLIEGAGNGVVKPRKMLYIDDLCVDEDMRGRHIGASLYEKALELARGEGCDAITLRVWELNKTARAFYDSVGMKPLYTEMEICL